MAFFKFRKDGEEHAAPAPAPESIETLRKRARYRLVGAAILVLAGVIGFPLLFDNQPRPIAVNIPIDIPDKAQSKPLVAPVPLAAASETQTVASAGLPVAAATVAATAAAAAVAAETQRSPASAAPAKVDAGEEVVIAGPSPKPVSKPAAKPVATPVVKDAPRAEAKSNAAKGSVTQEHQSKSADAAKAQALLDGKPVEAAKPAAADSSRFVVQFGSYTDAAKAHEARMKVERAGLKTYAQQVPSAEGKKFRVRVGPFERRADAEKAAEKIKKLNLPTSILEL